MIDPEQDHLRTRRRFRIVDLVVILIVVGLFGSVAAFFILSSQSSSRRIGCINNMKMMGIAVHNYHGVYQGIVPTTLATLHGLDSSSTPPEVITMPNSVSWGVMLL